MFEMAEEIFKLKLNKKIAKKLLAKALEKECFRSLNNSLQNNTHVKILSIWKPSNRFTIADILVARVIAAAAVLGADCHVRFSYPWTGAPLSNLKRRHVQNYCIHVYNDIYLDFCGKALVTVDYLRPASIEIEDTIKQRYKYFIRIIKDNPPEEAAKILGISTEGARRIKYAGWVDNEDYVLPMIAMVIEFVPNFIICGKKHNWIWEDFVWPILTSSGKSKVTKNLYVKDIISPDGDGPLDSVKDCCVFATSPNRHIEDALRRIDALGNSKFLTQVFELLILPSIPKQNLKTYKKWYLSIPRGNQNVHFLAQQIYESLKQIREYARRHNNLLKEWDGIEVTNMYIIEVVDSLLRFTTDPLKDMMPDQIEEEEKINPRVFYEASKQTLQLLFNEEPLRYELINMLQQCKDLDIHLHLIEKYYRDHFSHQFNVFGLGLLLLHSRIEESLSLKKYIANIYGLNDVDGERAVEQSWCVASLFHDHAIPLEYFLKKKQNASKIMQTNEINTKLSEVIKAIESATPDIYSHQLWDNAEDIIKEISQNLELLSYDEKKWYDHGLLAAVNLYKKFESKFSEVPWLKHALRAIAQHNISSELKFEKDPLSTLLILCDELHEWQRPLFAEDKFVYPIKKIILNMRQRTEGEIEFPEQLRVYFVCSSRDKLEKAKWQENIFLSAKEEAMKKIVMCSEVFPSGIVVFVNVPTHEMSKFK